MENSKKLILEKIISINKSSEKKYKEGDFKGAIEDKREVKSILNTKTCDNEIRTKFKESLSQIYISKFDLIYDHKKRIDDIKRNSIISSLEKKSAEKYKNGDFKGAIKALRRSEKYQ